MHAIRTTRMIALALMITMITGVVCAEELVVYGGEAFAPQIYLDNGEPAGLIPAMLKRLSADTGDTYLLVLVPWKRALSESLAGKGGITSFSWTKERALDYDYSDPLVDDPVHITVLKERLAEFRDLNSLKGKVIGIPLGSSFSAELNQAILDHVYLIDPDSGPVSRLKKLLIGRIDAALIGDHAIRQISRPDPELTANLDKFATLPFPLEHDWQYLAFPKTMHMHKALARFNKALAALKKSRDYQKIVDAYSLD